MTTISAAPARPALTRSGAGDLAWWVALTVLCLVLLVPLLVVDVPPLVDYPNHLARVFVLASLPGDTILARFYASHWSIIPNLALDLIAPPLTRVLPVYVVGRLLIAVAVLLPVWGTVAYNTALGGRWWSLGVGLIAYNSCLLYGFLNFLISLGLALLLAAGWLRWREDRPWRAIALALAGTPVLFACHLMGLVFFGLLIGGTELFRLYSPPSSRTRSRLAPNGPRRHGLLRSAIVRALVLLLVFAIPAGLYAVSALRQLGGDAEFLPVGEKLIQLVTTFVNYVWPLDLATASLAIALPTLSVLLRWGRVPGPAACGLALLLITFLAAPYAWKATYALDTRVAIMLGFMLFAGFVPTRWPPALRFVAVAGLVLFFVARMAILTTAWAAHATDLADLRRVLAPVRPGQAVYVAEASLQDAPAYWAANPGWRLLADGVRTDEHLGALILIEHRAYWPFEFDNPSQQPMETLEPYRALAGQVGNLPSRQVAAVANVCGFDYVLMMEADAVPDLPATRFRLLVRSGFAALYAITKCEADG
jgi:hypothetical protein